MATPKILNLQVRAISNGIEVTTAGITTAYTASTNVADAKAALDAAFTAVFGS